MNTLDNYFHNTFTEQHLQQVLDTSSYDIIPQLHHHYMMNVYQHSRYFFERWIVQPYPSWQKTIRLMIDIEAHHYFGHRSDSESVPTSIKYRWSATDFRRRFERRNCLTGQEQGDAYSTPLPEDDINITSIFSTHMFEIIGRKFRDAIWVYGSQQLYPIDILCAASPAIQDYLWNILSRSMTWMIHMFSGPIDPHHMSHPMVAKYEMLYRFYSYIAFQYKIQDPSFHSNTIELDWAYVESHHGEMIIPPFSYQQPTKSAHWFGPPVRQYCGTISHLQPGIADMRVILDRLHQFAGETILDLIQHHPDRFNMYITGSIIPACLVRHVPVPGLTWDEYIGAEYADADVDILFASKSLKTYMMALAELHRSASLLGAEFKICHRMAITVTCRHQYITEELHRMILDAYYRHRQYSVEDVHDNIIIRQLQERQCETLTSINDIHVGSTQPDPAHDYLTTSFTVQFGGMDIHVKVQDIVRLKVQVPHSRPFEIFYSSTNPELKIQSFHLPCVRGYFRLGHADHQRWTCHMHPSLYNTLLTGCNQDCNMILTNQYHPAEIIHKYHRRGFGTLMTIQEEEIYYQVLREKGLVSPDWAFVPAPGCVDQNASLYEYRDDVPIFRFME